MADESFQSMSLGQGRWCAGRALAHLIAMKQREQSVRQSVDGWADPRGGPGKNSGRPTKQAFR